MVGTMGPLTYPAELAELYGQTQNSDVFEFLTTAERMPKRSASPPPVEPKVIFKSVRRRVQIPESTDTFVTMRIRN